MCCNSDGLPGITGRLEEEPLPKLTVVVEPLLHYEFLMASDRVEIVIGLVRSGLPELIKESGRAFRMEMLSPLNH